MKTLNPKNPNIYRARFDRLRVHVFGRDQILPGELVVEVYQSRVQPARWKARPESRHTANWQAGYADVLMEMIASYFDRCIEPWHLDGIPDQAFPDVTRDLPRRLQSPWDEWPVPALAETPGDASERAQAKTAPVLSRGGWVQ